MSETAAPPAPPLHDAVWRRLVMDSAAFQHAYPTPAHLAELVMQTADLAYEHGLRDGGLPPAERPQPMTPARIVAGVMDHAAQMRGHSRLAALYALAHVRTHAVPGQHAKTSAPAVAEAETKGGNCDG